MLDVEFLIREGIAHVPHSRDALTRAKDAKVAKPRQEPRLRSGQVRGADAEREGLILI